MSRFDPLSLLALLTRHKVDFIVIGGVAASALGSPMVTFDLDICYARDEVNLNRLAEALIAIKAHLRGAPRDLPFLLDAETLERGDHFTFDTDLGPLDILGTPAGTKGFEELARNAVAIDFEDVSVRVTGLMDLMRMKTAAGRPKDRIALANLEALLDELEGR